MLGNITKKIFGTPNDRYLKNSKTILENINSLEGELEKLNDDELKKNTLKLKEKFISGESLESLLPLSFATVREASKRILGQRHYDVQMIGGIALHQGKISEMKTGEGKTLVSTLPAYLNAISGKGVHIVTVNDYLAKRDSKWMGKIYEFLGLNVGCVVPGINDEERKKAYNCDITYGTNNEFGFDFLRDNMKFEINQMVQRSFNFAIIDEVDSILIDEARTPLIISGPTEDNSELYNTVNNLIPKLKDEDMEIDEKAKSVTLTEKGNENVEKILRESSLIKDQNLYDPSNINVVHHINQAIKAHNLFEKDKDYIVKDGKLIIIDEFTGRMMEGRRYSDGLHQALEAKERISIQNENQTLAAITFQNYFRMYPKLSGMTGTAATEAEELMEIYNLEVVTIPTHKNMIRSDENDEVYRTASEKWDAVIREIAEANQKKQPILVGTTSIEKSEMLSKLLKKERIKHSVLNARHHEEEANIVAQAGVPGSVTIATNMAGRGTDIQLGGNPEMLKNFKGSSNEKLLNDIESNKNLTKSSRGLYVIGTERHESRRTDNQLRGRSGRQGDPGKSKFFLSLEDDLMRIFGSEKLDSMLLKLGLKEGEAIVHNWITKALEKAQQKVEARNFEIRKNLLRFDDVMNDQRKAIYEQRKDLILSQDVSETIQNMRKDVIESLIEANIPAKAYPEQWDIKSLNTSLKELGMSLPISDWSKEEGIAEEEIKERILDSATKRSEEKLNLLGSDNMKLIEKQVMLQIIDQNWKEHLLQLDHIRQGIGLRAYAQRDPLNEYKSEAFGLFQLMLDKVRMQTTAVLLNIQITTEIRETNDQKNKYQEYSENIEEKNKNLQGGIQSKKIGRNVPCPCGSGKKYKHCHGKAA